MSRQLPANQARELVGGLSKPTIIEIDRRGYIYLVDRADNGMHIVTLTGAAAKIVSP